MGLIDGDQWSLPHRFAENNSTPATMSLRDGHEKLIRDRPLWLCIYGTIECPSSRELLAADSSN